MKNHEILALAKAMPKNDPSVYYRMQAWEHDKGQAEVDKEIEGSTPATEAPVLDF